MKKFIIAAMVLLLVCSTAVFARYGQESEPEIEDYTGLTVGGSYVYETYKVATGTEIDKEAQLLLGLSDYLFASPSPFGLYVDVGLLINLKESYRINGVSIEENATKAPVYATMMVGLGYRANLARNLDLLLGVGPEFTYFSTEYSYYDTHDERHTVTKDYISLGLGLDAEIMYKLGGDFYFSVGGKASLLFLKWMTKEDHYAWDGYQESYSSADTEDYFGYRFTPKLTFYYLF